MTWIKGAARCLNYTVFMILRIPRMAFFIGLYPARFESLARALFALTKPRLACFSILSGMTGYAAAASEGGWPRLLASLAGISLAAGGALSLNQWWERETDALMRRTAARPLPSGKISPAGAFAWTLALGAGGAGVLAVTAGPLAAALAVAIIVLYGLVYTPLKRRTRWATEIGSLSGAMPPLLGAAAAGDALAPGAWLLAGILLFWQMPHFFAIGWMYRADYRAAGFPLRPAVDATGRNTAAWSLAHVLLLATVSLLPWAAGWSGWIYGVTALAGAAAMLAAGIRFLTDAENRDRRARQLFLTTLLYLPPVMAALVMDVR